MKEIIIDPEYTPNEVAKICRVDYKTVIRWIRERKIVYLKRGGRYYITKNNLIKFLRGEQNGNN